MSANVPKRRFPLSRPPLARMLRIHEKLKHQRHPNCQKLAEELEVSSKTIQRDILFMRDQLGLPIEYDPDEYGYFYTQAVNSFPTIQVSEGELVALFVAEKAMAQYRGTPFEAPLHAAFEKLTSGLTEHLTFAWCDLDSAISFRPLGTPITDLKLFRGLSQAVVQSKEVEFEYRKLGGSAHESRRVRPYHLACVDNQWYLIGFDCRRNGMRTFVLSRMRKLRVTAWGFTKPADFSIAQYLGQSFGVFTGQGNHQVRIRFDAFAATLVRERQWHASQKIKELGKGEIELSLKLGSLHELQRWILSWGAHARVLAPKELVQSIRQEVKRVLHRYGS
jgi:predicted DNA-binding transcriptional regulator YafY